MNTNAVVLVGLRKPKSLCTRSIEACQKAFGFRIPAFRIVFSRFYAIVQVL